MPNTHIRFDWAMKRLLRNKANFEILEGFLSELFNDDIKIIEILESESNQQNSDDKYNRVDILVKDNKDELVLVEVQNDSERDYFHRMNYGQAKLLTEHLDLGQKYEQIKKIYSVNIVYFDLGQGDDYVYVGKTEFEGLHYKDKLQLSTSQKKYFNLKNVSDIFTTYYVIKVNKFNDLAKNSLDEWIYFLKNNEIKDNFKARGLKPAKEKLRIDKLSKEERLAFDNYIKNWRIKEAETDTAKYEGILEAEKKYKPLLDEARQKEQEAKQKEQEAKQKEQETKQKLVKIMHEFGTSIEKIVQETNLSKEEIENIIKNDN